MNNTNLKKKILFFHHCSAIGGAGLSGLNVLKAIPKEKYELIVYCNSENSGMAEIYTEEGFKVIFAGKSPVAFSHYSGGEIFALSYNAITNYIKLYFDRKRISTTLHEIKPDIVIVNSMTLFWIGKMAKKVNAETICFFRETYAENLFGLRNKMIRHYLSKNFDKISFLSKYDQDKSTDVNCIKTTIYNMIPHHDFSKLLKPVEIFSLGLNINEFNVLYVGGMSQLKGAIIAIKALSKVKNENIKLIFVGYKWNGLKKKISDCIDIKKKIKYILGMDYEAICIKCILSNNLKDKIAFFDLQKNILPFYIACDALISPSIKPHQARPIFEAGLAKIPVIVSDFPNIKEFIDEESGFIFKNKDFNKLAELLDTISKDMNIVQRKVERNYNNSLNRHTANVFYPKIVELLT